MSCHFEFFSSLLFYLDFRARVTFSDRNLPTDLLVGRYYVPKKRAREVHNEPERYLSLILGLMWHNAILFWVMFNGGSETLLHYGFS